MVSGPNNYPSQTTGSSGFTGAGDFDGQTAATGGGNFGPSTARTQDPNARPVFGSGSGVDGQVMVGTGQFYGTPAPGPAAAYAGMGIDRPGSTVRPVTVPASVYAGDVQRWGLSLDPADQEMYLIATGLMQDWGKLGETFTVEEASAVWQDVLLGASYNQSMTPFEYLELMASRAAVVPEAGAPVTSTYTGTSSETTTSSTTDTDTVLSNEFDARAILDGALLNYLGRRATDKERAAFLNSLNSMESDNPTVRQTDGTTSTTSTTNSSETATPGTPARPATPGTGGPSSENGPAARAGQPAVAATGPSTARTSSTSSNVVTDRSSTQTGGFNREQYAVDYARANPLYAETQAATTLMGWLEKAVMNAGQRRMV